MIYGTPRPEERKLTVQCKLIYVWAADMMDALFVYEAGHLCQAGPWSAVITLPRPLRQLLRPEMSRLTCGAMRANVSGLHSAMRSAFTSTSTLSDWKEFPR